MVESGTNNTESYRQPKYVGFEELGFGASEEHTLGMYIPQSSKTIKYPGESVIGVRERTFIPTMDARIRSRILPQIDEALINEMENDTVDVLRSLKSHIENSLVILTNPDITDVLKKSVYVHEEAHARQDFKEEKYSEMINEYQHMFNSEYLPRREFRRTVFRHEVLADMDAYNRQLFIVSEEYESKAKEAVLYSFVLDKAVYPFLPGFDIYYQHCKHGKLASYEANVFGVLSLITMNPDLVEQIWSGEIDIPKLRRQVIEQLKIAEIDMDKFISDRTSPDFIFEIEANLHESASIGFKERDRLIAIGQL